MTIFVDTSALHALLDSDDLFNGAAAQAWQEFAADRASLVTSNYVIVETMSLAARRLGFHAARALHDQLVPLLDVVWVDERLHGVAESALMIAGQRGLSLVDCVSFAAMRRHGLDTAFAFDRHFAEQGFRCVPQPLG